MPKCGRDHSGRNPPGPPCDARLAHATLPGGALGASERAGRSGAARAIVAREDHQGVPIDLLLAKRPAESRPRSSRVPRRHRRTVPPGSCRESGCSPPSGQCGIVVRQVEKERFSGTAALSDELRRRVRISPGEQALVRFLLDCLLATNQVGWAASCRPTRARGLVALLMSLEYGIPK